MTQIKISLSSLLIFVTSQFMTHMNCIYDLHTHTLESDGKYTPSELIEHAIQAGIDFLAITDHDTTSGLEEAYQATTNRSIKLIAGVELSVKWQEKNFHIVGLNVDPENKILSKGLEKHRQERELRAIKIGQRLEKYGIPGAYIGAKQLAGNNAVTRNHFARFLVDRGLAKNIRDVFKHYLVKSKPGYVKTNWTSMENGIHQIKSSGGIPVLAHPLRYRLTGSWMRKLLVAFKEAEGVGLEIVTGNCTADNMHTCAGYARRYGLSGSVGSDYHGHEKEGPQLGKLKNIPDDILPVWKQW